ncbi:hypothetical protein M3639_20845, partial [Alkalihalobacillus rhizosphaerae]|nr:hypothetical protein [Shouchella rhizosphaerae]
RDARERYTRVYGIPVVEVIQPAVRRAVASTRNGRIGVIGTAATVGSRAYDDTFAAAPHLELRSVACPAFVDYVEAGPGSPPAPTCSRRPSATSTPCAAPRWTPSCWAAPTTRC